MGKGINEIQYDSSEEGFFGPTGPIISKSSELYFLLTNDWTRMLKYTSNKLLEAIIIPEELEQLKGARNLQFTSQNGSIGFSLFVIQQDSSYWNLLYKSDLGQYLTEIDMTYTEYLMTYGLLIYSDQKKLGVAFSVLGEEDFEVIRNEDLKSWLPTQPGGFTIGDDGLLYRNGMLWSAQEPINGSYAYKYIGRLMSGHQVWVGGGIANFIRYVTISNSEKQIELILELPWAPQMKPREYGYHPFNYGLGPWGEIYALIAPYFDEKTPWQPIDGDNSELVVVRNHLKYFGRLNDGGVRLRKEPNTSSDILGTYPNKTGFRILETGTEQETLGGQTAPWYKVRLLDGTEGWFFGAFVHNLYDGPNGNPPPWPNVPDW